MTAELQPIPRTVQKPFDTASIDVTAMLLFLQAGFGLISLIGTIVFGFFLAGPILIAPSVALGAAGVVLPIVFARGILRVKRKLRTGTIIYQVVILLALTVRLWVGGEYAVGLLPLLTSGVLPLTILAVVFNRSCRQAFAKQRRPKKTKKTKASPVVSIEPAGAIERVA